ncbi:hypothetical protein [Stigmatella aurantiaca]|nr:hypothetical protein [Stigmatella aurantiaca]
MKGNRQEAIVKVSQGLGLPIGDSFSQDWAYELPEEFRTKGFFERYVGAYSTPEYGHTEKHVLMQLILDVANDLLEQKDGLEGRAWERVEAFLQVDREIHWDLIEHWALMGEPLENVFPLTSRMRVVREKIIEQ